MDLPKGRANRADFWAHHVEQAQKFTGSDKEYCLKNGLNQKTFSVHKRKLGYAKARNTSKTKADFVPVQSDAESVDKLSTAPAIDPKWLAEFLIHLGAKI